MFLPSQEQSAFRLYVCCPFSRHRSPAYRRRRRRRHSARIIFIIIAVSFTRTLYISALVLVSRFHEA